MVRLTPTGLPSSRVNRWPAQWLARPSPSLGERREDLLLSSERSITEGDLMVFFELTNPELPNYGGSNDEYQRLLVVP